MIHGFCAPSKKSVYPKADFLLCSRSFTVLKKILEEKHNGSLNSMPYHINYIKSF